MLEEDDSRKLIEALWEQLGCAVDLAEDDAVYFAAQGFLPAAYTDKRRFRRIHFRDRAVLEHDNAHYAVYTKDICRSGVAFLHAHQLFPGDRVRLFLASGLVLSLVIRRSIQIRDQCFECGGELVATRRPSVLPDGKPIGR